MPLDLGLQKLRDICKWVPFWIFSSLKLSFCHKINCTFLLGATRFSSSTVEATAESLDSKDEDVVFVAGATGKVGSRTVRSEVLIIELRVENFL